MSQKIILKPANLAALSLKDARFRKRVIKSKKVYDRKKKVFRDDK